MPPSKRGIHPESLLPPAVLAKASVSAGGEHGWRPEDFEAVIEAAISQDLACVGGQIQWQFPDGTCEAYWLNYDAEERLAEETWEEYVRRSCSQVRDGFRRLAQSTDWTAEARQWAFLRKKMEAGEDPERHRFCMLYFSAEAEGTHGAPQPSKRWWKFWK